MVFIYSDDIQNRLALTIPVHFLMFVLDVWATKP